MHACMHACIHTQKFKPVFYNKLLGAMFVCCRQVALSQLKHPPSGRKRRSSAKKSTRQGFGFRKGTPAGVPLVTVAVHESTQAAQAVFFPVSRMKALQFGVVSAVVQMAQGLCLRCWFLMRARFRRFILIWAEGQSEMPRGQRNWCC